MMSREEAIAVLADHLAKNQPEGLEEALLVLNQPRPVTGFMTGACPLGHDQPPTVDCTSCRCTCDTCWRRHLRRVGCGPYHFIRLPSGQFINAALIQQTANAADGLKVMFAEAGCWSNFHGKDAEFLKEWLQRASER